MTEPSRAVFLSYASQDAEAASRICEALRVAGIEVWFDQSELRGGDAWDAAIRKQIKACALFVPVISANAHARIEGYFRLEWKLAVDRSYFIAPDQTFLLPVVIDGSSQADERIPDRFRELQWSRLTNGETPPAFVERISRLLSPAEPHVSAARKGQPTGTAHASPSTHKGSAPTTKPSSGTKPALWLIAAAVAIAVSYLAVEKLVVSKRPSASTQTTASTAPSGAAAPSTIAEKSIAVLPFVDMSEKKDQEYFSDGLSEELIDMLTKVPDLRVPARTSSFFFKGKSEDIATIAQKLRVAHVLEGSVRKSGHTVRVTAQLIRADNGYNLWSETYDRDLKDIFRVQDEIADAVVAALKLKLVPGPQSANAHRTENSEAYNQYLLGRQFLNRGNVDGYRRATVAYRKAVTIDPSYAAAYAGLAFAEAFVADELGDLASFKRAESLADRALALAPEQADGYAARGFIRLTFNWDWRGAQADFDKALAIDPANSSAKSRRGELLAALDGLPNAVVATQQAIALDPLALRPWLDLGRDLTAGGKFAAAHDALQRALEISPESDQARMALGILRLLEGNAAEALVTFRQSGHPTVRLFGTAAAEHTLGHVRESQQALEELIETRSQDPFQVAEVYAWRGEKDKAFEWLDRAYRQHDGGLSYVRYDPLLASLRGDSRYMALLRKMKLPET